MRAFTARLRSKDFWAGTAFVLIGALALWFGRDLAIGTARRMGPGYFPTILGVILCGLGLVIAARGLLTGTEAVERGTLRPVLVLVAVVAFGLLLEQFGFVIASLALIAIGSLAGRESRLVEIGVLSLGLILFALAVFICGLGVPVSVWPN